MIGMAALEPYPIESFTRSSLSWQMWTTYSFPPTRSRKCYGTILDERKFALEDLVDVHHLLGIQIIWNRNQRTIQLYQEKYNDSVLRRFKMYDCKLVANSIGHKVDLIKNSLDEE
jgi:DUF2075 family protein